jgi:hypothetical protein
MPLCSQLGKICFAFLASLGLCWSPAGAVTLDVDFGWDNAGNQVQAGFEDFSVAAENGNASPQVRSFASPLAAGTNVDVTLSVTSSTIGSRDRGDVSHDLGLGDLLEDFVFHNGGANMTLTLGGLKAGTYTLTTWHHDEISSQQPLDVLVDDAVDTGRVKVAALEHSRDDADLGAANAKFTFTADGTNPVVVHLNEHASQNGVPVFNGFSISDDATLPAELKIDFGPNVPQDVQAGFQPFTRGNPGDAGPDLSKPHPETFFTALGIAGSVRTVLDASSTGVGFRDRGDVTHPLGDLAEDFTYNRNPSDELILELHDLMPGVYHVESFFHDRNFSQGVLDVAVDDAMGTGRAVASGLAQSDGASPADVSRAAFAVFANGSDPVVLRYLEDAAALNVALAGVTVADFSPGSLRVDFGADAGNDNDVQDGFEDFSLTANNNVSSPQTRTFASELSPAGSVSVTLDSSTTLGSRDRGDVVHLLGDLAEDFIFNTEPDDEMTMTLAGLRRGAYAMTTYFHDRDFSTQGEIDILVDDALGLDRLVADDLRQSWGASPDDVSSATFLLHFNGTDPVTLYFREEAASLNVALAGFSLSQVVPEPGSLALLAVGALALLAGARPKRRRA